MSSHIVGAVLIWIGCVTICAPSAANIWLKLRHRTRRFDTSVLNVAGDIIMIAGNVLRGEWAWTAAFAVLLVLSLFRLRRRVHRPQPDDGGFLP